MEPAVAYLHFLAVMGVAACLGAEFFLCNEHLQPGHVRMLARIDFGYIVFAVLVFLTGLLAVLAVGRGPWATLSQPLFWLKLAAFVALAVLSIFPTTRYSRWSRAIAAGEERILNGRDIIATRRMIGVELALLGAMPLLATVAARVGH
jgi:putative membrane protein